ncbi:helix-turn-helix transcriptional regulator [Patescibacteria group bacterium]|nr:helix-turn-helix transcriptional regulator [Patescibacteria group bacterium]MBU1890608.1 helix-turn-helix transcriptional regulator [Patescibacteria group bacterium]
MTNNIKQLRSEFRLTQEDLAEKVSVTRQTIIAVEQNKYVPSLALAYNIAKVFKKPIEDIFYFNQIIICTTLKQKT